MAVISAVVLLISWFHHAGQAFASLAPPLPSSQTLLPNTTTIDRLLTTELGVDHFFNLWIVFNNDDHLMSDKAFTILAPVNNATVSGPVERLGSGAVRKLLLDHMVLGQKLDLNIGADLTFTTLGGRTVSVRGKQGQLLANGAKVLKDKVDVGLGRLIILENYLFPEDLTGDHSFLQEMTEVLSFLQSGVRVFQHLLARSNVTKLLKKDEEYTVFVPTDRAFQRWHPIDWGFYPFSVPEFTESILLNHFVAGNIKQDSITDKQTFKTLGGKEIIFTKASDGSLKLNGAEVVKGDTPITKGNIMFLGEVLFVDDSTVHRLHESHKDKETPPLLAFPWFGAQFLSHAFLALETNSNFTHITRFLNVADLAPHIPGAGYTFFVPTDKAFEKLGLGNAPDNLLSANEGLEILLSHFVKGRLYDRDIKDKINLTALSNRTLTVQRKNADNGTIEGAKIIESEVFVYNLGTMFFIDKVIYGDEIPMVNSVEGATQTTENPYIETGITKESELSGETGTYPDILMQESTTSQDSEYTAIP